MKKAWHQDTFASVEEMPSQWSDIDLFLTKALSFCDASA
jgi:hypothetical protein